MKVVHDDVFRRLCRARDLVHERSSKPLTVAQLARSAGVSPFHFFRLFREAFGETVFVLGQDRAYDFYVNKLGFEVRTDAKMGDFRWLTVGPKGQPDLEVALMEVKPGPMLDEARCKVLTQHR